MKLLSVSEVAEILRTSRKYVYDMVRQGRLPGKKIGGLIRIPEEKLYEAFGANTPESMYEAAEKAARRLR